MYERIKTHLTWEPATLFGLGNVTYAPGTMGSLVTVPIVFLLNYTMGDKAVFVFMVAAFLFGLWVTKRYLARYTGPDNDPKEVIIDEVVGQTLALFMLPPSPILYGLAFVLFRFFDIVKPWPVSWADRQIKGEVGIMLDDIIAGLYAWIIIQFYFFFMY